MLSRELAERLAPAQASVFGFAARGLKPRRMRSVDVWADEERFVSPESGSPVPGKWSNATVPYLVEPMQVMSLSDPARLIAIPKGAQLGFTEAGLNAALAAVQDDPCPILVVLPGLDEVIKYNKVKLQPAIDATPGVKNLVAESKSRDDDGSTSRFKRFPGGFMQLTGANASSGLQMISVRMVIAEERAEYPADAGGRGDPFDQAVARTNAYRGREKVIVISTSGLKGACGVTSLYEASDRRRYFVPCPHCGTFQVLRFVQLDQDSAAYSCAGCGADIHERHKPAMLARGVWLRTYPAETGETAPSESSVLTADEVARWRARPSGGREPGFHLSALYSPFMPWLDVVKQYRDSLGKQLKEKVFAQQVLGEAWEAKTETPDAKRLFDTRFDWPSATVPPGVLFITGAADVQGDRIEWAFYGWGYGFTRWHLGSGVIPGDPTTRAPWDALDAVRARVFRDAGGAPLQALLFGVDTGYQTNHVYAYVRRCGSDQVRALDGKDGWMLPALGTPTKQDIAFDGKKIGEVLLWPVGTYPLKRELYSALAKTLQGPAADTGRWAEGAAFFGPTCDLRFFEQITAEYLAERINKRDGSVSHVWVRSSGAANEQLDLAVYAAALAHALADSLDDAGWARLAADRARAAVPPQGDFFAVRLEAPAVAPAEQVDSVLPPPPAPDAIVQPAPHVAPAVVPAERRAPEPAAHPYAVPKGWLTPRRGFRL